MLLADGRGLEFRLNNVKLADQRGVIVAQAPDAAVTLSGAALWTGRIAPSRIILIEPSLVLQHSRERGFSLVFTDPVAPGTTPAPNAPAAGAQGEAGALLGVVLSQAGQSTGSASYIKGIGLRNATLAIDSAGQRTVLRVREADLGVDRRRQGSLLGANIALESARGPWQITLVATRDEAANATSIDVRFAEVLPSAIVGAGPLLSPLSVFEIPVRGSGTIRLSGSGEVTSALVDLDLGTGAIAPGWKGNGKLPVEGGRLSFKYIQESRRLALAT